MRNINHELIKQADIDHAVSRYVDYYVTDADATFYDYSETKNVVAYGVVLDIFERINTEISDRGITKLSIPGTGMVNIEEKRALKRELHRRLLAAISIMIEKAEDEGYELDEDHEDYVYANYVIRSHRSTVL